MGEALVALQHDDLKQMGITSVGHRLTILKSVYDIKVKQDIPIESDHYVPLSKYSTLTAYFSVLRYLSGGRGGSICDGHSQRHQDAGGTIKVTG